MIIMPAEWLYDAMCRALVLVSDVFASRGYLLNIGPAKTAALMCLRGKGAKIAKRDIWHSHGGMWGGNSALLGHVTAPVVRNYVHLGSVIDATGAMMSEIRYRATSTTDTRRVLRTKVFGPSDMSDSTRMMFADSLVMSGRLYNAGAWPSPTQGEARHRARPHPRCRLVWALVIGFESLHGVRVPHRDSWTTATETWRKARSCPRKALKRFAYHRSA
mgnify:CR=1 FL=1